MALENLREPQVRNHDLSINNAPPPFVDSENQPEPHECNNEELHDRDADGSLNEHIPFDNTIGSRSDSNSDSDSTTELNHAGDGKYLKPF